VPKFILIVGSWADGKTFLDGVRYFNTAIEDNSCQ